MDSDDFSQYEARAFKHIRKTSVPAHIFGVTLWIAAMASFFAAGLAFTDNPIGIAGYLFIAAVYAASFNPLVQIISTRHQEALAIPGNLRIASLAGLVGAIAWVIAYLNIYTPIHIMDFNTSLILGFSCIICATVIWKIADIPARRFRFLSYIAMAPGAIGMGVLLGIIIRGLH